MRRLMAWLLALLLPCSALADTAKLTVRAEMNEAFVDVLVEHWASVNADTTRAELVMQMAQRIIDGFKLELRMQEDEAASCRAYLGDSELFDVTCYHQAGIVYAVTSLLPGYAIAEEAKDYSQNAADPDWSEIADAAAEAAQNWFSTLTPVVTRGAFIGDAYTGGTQCAAWELSVQDIASLLDAAVPDELRGALQALCGGDQDVFQAFHDALSSAAADGYSFILRAVSNDAAELVGLSVTVLRANEQIASISLGGSETGIIVVGLGLSTQNYWWEIDFNRASMGETTLYSGVSREWTAPKTQSFPFVQANAEPQAEYAWSLMQAHHHAQAKWRFTLSAATEDAQNALLSFEIAQESTEELAPMPEDLSICTSADPEQYDALVEQLSMKLAARMIKLLPMDLIFQLNMLP